MYYLFTFFDITYFDNAKFTSTTVFKIMEELKINSYFIYNALCLKKFTFYNFFGEFWLKLEIF